MSYQPSSQPSPARGRGSKVCLALGLGGLLPLTLAPCSYDYLAFLIPGALWWLLTPKNPLSPKHAFWVGWVFGIGVFGVGASWVYVSIHDYGYTSVPLAGALTGLFVVALGLFFALQGWLYVQWVPPFAKEPAPSLSRGGLGGILKTAFLFSSIWVLFEWIRSWFLGGFPWLYIGYSQLDTVLGKGFAPLGGVFLVSWLVVVMSVLLYAAGQHLILTLMQALHALKTVNQEALTVGQMQKALQQQLSKKGWLLASASLRPTKIMLIAILIIPCAGMLLAEITWTKEVGKPLSVAIVQPNVPQDIKWSDKALLTILQQNLELTAPLWGTDLILWPENAIPLYSDLSAPYLDMLTKQAQKTKSLLITGVPLRASPQAPYFNGLMLLGASNQSYAKRRLVPFGEFIPLEKLLRGLIDFFNLPMSDFGNGPSDQPGLVNKTVKIGPSICYEIAYPADVASMAKKSNLLVTVSNDTWFGKSFGPKQHFQMARFRALETGQYLLRGTNNGITAIIDPHGNVQTIAPAFTQTTLKGTVFITEGATPYVRYQNIPILILLLLSVGFACWCLKQSPPTRPVHG